MRAALLGVDGVERADKVVVVNEPSRPQRPGLVATIVQAVRGDYMRAARMLGRLDVDVVLLQHEYGIFGGADGEYVLSLAEGLSQPLVVTLHTVLSEPTLSKRRCWALLCRQAERVIVMTETARPTTGRERNVRGRQGADRSARGADHSRRTRRGISRRADDGR